ncbi:MAG: hypothetical protein HY908_10005, partial [Myxococcales bacterium]|nr:hypothetical protein [Myxococcales bacterium]
AVAPATAGALYFHAGQAPLGRAVLFVGPFVWAALALTVAALVQAARRVRFRFRGHVAAALVLGAGVALYVHARGILTSPARMWQRALEIEPSNESAIRASAAALRAARRWDEVVVLGEKCIAVQPAACLCQVLRAEGEVRARRLPAGLEHARTSADLCGTSAAAHQVYAEALALSEQPERALSEADRGVELLAVADADKERSASALRYARALALWSLKRTDEAREEAARAADGGDRDARLAAAYFAIVSQDLQAADHWLAVMLADDPADGDALYNTAFVADQRNDYNRAREGYLATLRASPDYALARYKLAELTLRFGVKDEALHHADKFMADYPGDPRGPELKARIARQAPAGR